MYMFESFSEDLIPRVVPQPTVLPAQNNSQPIVPEVSLIIDHSKSTKTTETNSTKTLSYKQWRQQHTADTSENLITQDLIKKKNVTFANASNLVSNKITTPIFEQNKTASSSQPITMPCNALDLSLCDQIPTSTAVKNQESQRGSKQMLSAVGVPTSKPLYCDTQKLGNIAQKPNDEQDFRLNDAYRLIQFDQNQNDRPFQNDNYFPSNRLVERNPPEISKEITMTDLYQLVLKTLQPTNQGQSRTMNQTDQSQQMQPVKQIIPKNTASQEINTNLATVSPAEPTVKDLFQIILKQQEQLMAITKQLQCIVSMNQPRSEQPNPALQQCYRNQIDEQNFMDNAIFRQSPSSNSLGVMTSLEINVQKCNGRVMPDDEQNYIANVHSGKNHSNNFRKHENRCCCNCKASQAHCYNGNNDEISDPSNESSCDDQDEFNNLPNGKQKDNNLAFYGNILDQVNDVLKNSPPNMVRNPRQQQYEDRQQSHQVNLEWQNQYQEGSDAQQFNPVLSSNIRTAKFKQIGFQFDDVNISATSKRVTFDSNPIPNLTRRYQTNYNIQPSPNTEQSIFMKALAKKYLPKDDSLNALPWPAAPANATVTNRICHEFSTPPHNSTNNLNIRKSTSDTSLANYRYLEKYGLL